ncbi:DUF1667 domain-containing protein [Clostridium sp. MSJ-11]|uniref:DUF1667 domain-containing protein n=1 Tax=Clostridium mobile TaxID=2841512 RepID=A0ABS6EFI1_9CLOT|nr:DUF1667 domain-containing protein [Clostridium mobile]MBU5483912.1 DUF1667 domain-containing protein [Clostridium mobile]
MLEKTVVCTTCPLECTLKLTINNDAIESISGNKCSRGIDYAKLEFIDPQRIFTSTLLIKDNNKESLLPIRSSKPISQKLFKEIIEIVNKTEVSPPIKMGDIIINNILNSEINIVASRTIIKL